MSHRIDLGVGARFGQWTTLRPDDTPRRAASFWWCECECGTVKLVRSCDLRSGRSGGCGCKKNEKLTKHGHAHLHGAPTRQSVEYSTWVRAIGRCYDQGNNSYHRYGARGIAMCAEWRESFAAFLRDMGPRPPGTSIDRIDNNGNYSPANCRWATRSEQAINRRSTRWVTYKGERLCLKELAKKIGMKGARRFATAYEGEGK